MMVFKQMSPFGRHDDVVIIGNRECADGFAVRTFPILQQVAVMSTEGRHLLISTIIFYISRILTEQMATLFKQFSPKVSVFVH